MTDNEIVKPVLRWAGGKTWLTRIIKDFLPKEYNNYHEPFLGGASMFFFLQPRGVNYLSDTNPDLINFYSQIRGNLTKVLNVVKQFSNDEKSYYDIRSHRPTNKIEMAARFYYLNKTCFNGLYRVNKDGIFNVPYGFRKEVVLYDIPALKNLSSILKKDVILSKHDFAQGISNIKKNDLVFLDPPYTVAHNNNGFIEYNQHIFSWTDQERLSLYISQIKSKGAYFILTNAVHNSIIKLYENVGKRFEIERNSTISGHMKDRKKVSEFIITNCI